MYFNQNLPPSTQWTVGQCKFVGRILERSDRSKMQTPPPYGRYDVISLSGRRSSHRRDLVLSLCRRPVAELLGTAELIF